ncbi:sugar phosphate isomerase/epimerase family protein [Quadrisphaera setariae]|uniref:Sugar phosphate isomerase/epimerase n=1 Tax=Quadrisphaera setariae TaxID=2593304 RepID=A0A5C8ZGQ2_9ACTN|nr:TIM barrel protein [Quadrisphaera setariae]TXR56997.1 sugar phosphate isomerase/epimerase [Quadrisphaera setariae]
MWTLSGFSDEISDDFQEQCSVVRGLGMGHLELRSAWGTNVLDLDEAQVRRALEVLQAHDLRVSSIGSPVGKVHLDADVAEHLDRARRAVELAQAFGARYVRVFSFFLRPDEAPEQVRDAVLERMAALAEVAAAGDVVFLHENEKGIYGDVPARCADVLSSVASPHLRAAWDAANFVQVGVRPHTEGYALLRPHLEYVQVKDAHLATGEVVPAGRGDGEVLDTVRALHEDGFDGFFSLEPHLAQAHELGGFSGPELFTTAHTAFTGLLRAESISYR